MKALKDYPYTPEEREIPPDRVLNFDATPGFRGWSHLFTEDSKTHPAKMNLNLLHWIIDTYTEPGDTVLDPMAGTGSTAVLAAIAGRDGVAVEYETAFFDMAEANMNKAHRQGTFKPKGRMTLIHGDARELSKLLMAADVIVTSPPYGNRLADAAVSDGDPQRVSYRQAVDTIVTSPPYGKSQTGGGIFREGYTKPGANHVTDPGLPLRHSRPLSDDPRNIDNLSYGEVDAVVTSPPYQDSVPAQDEAWLEKHWDDPSESPKHTTMRFGSSLKGYPAGKDNLGCMKGETYMEAILKVYGECWKVLKHGGHMILVTRNFIRDKKVVRLDLDTIRICEEAGFRLLDRWYFKLPTKSFWINNMRMKHPDYPEVDYEDVLVFEKNSYMDDFIGHSIIEPQRIEEAIVA